MDHIFAFMTSVAANLVSDILFSLICKWLGGWPKDRKHN